MEHDENAIGVNLWGNEGKGAGLFGPFCRDIKIYEAIFWCRLAILAKYSAMTTNQVIISVLNNELVKRKEKYKHFEMKFENVNDD